MWLYGLLVSIIVLGISFSWFKKAAGIISISKPHMISWVFYYQLLLQSFLGINLAAVFGVSHYLMDKVSENYVVMAYWAVIYVLLVMPLTMIFVQRFILGGGIKRKIKKYFADSLRPLQSPKDSALITYWIILSGIAFVATAYVYYINRTSPFLALLTGISPEEFARLRIESSWEFSGNVLIKNLFSVMLAPIASYVAYGYLRLYKRNRLCKLWFGVTFITAVFANAYSGAKSPVIEYFIQLVLLKVLIDGGLDVRKAVFWFIFAVAFAYVLYGTTTGRWYIALNSGMVGRIVMGQIAGLPITFEAFPKRVPFLRGAGFPSWITSIFGIEHARASRIIMEIYNPRAVELGTAGVINTLYMGEAWANFGWPGFFIAPIVVGVVVQFIYNWLVSLPKTPVSVALMVYFMTSLPITGGFVEFIWNAGWVILFLLFFSAVQFRSFALLPVRGSSLATTECCNSDSLVGD